MKQMNYSSVELVGCDFDLFHVIYYALLFLHQIKKIIYLLNKINKQEKIAQKKKKKRTWKQVRTFCSNNWRSINWGDPNIRCNFTSSFGLRNSSFVASFYKINQKRKFNLKLKLKIYSTWNIRYEL